MENRQKVSMNFGKPCMGLFLQGGVKALSVVEAGVELSLMVVGTIAIIFVLPNQEVKDEKGSGSWKYYARLASWGYSYVYATASIFLSQRLFFYASQRDVRGVFKFLVISGVSYSVCLTNYILYTIFIGWTQASTMTVYLGFLIYKLYFFWVTIAFLKDLRRNAPLNPAMRELSDEEIQSFFNGRPYAQSAGDGDYEHNPYRMDFEIPLANFELDETTPLGRGAFGIVLKGILNKGSKQRVVAVKTLSNLADITYFKALLSELKILSYIGYHKHIVNLIGACTSEVKERKLFVLVEFCPYGSIANYLHENKDLFLHCFHVERLNRLNPSDTSIYVTAFQRNAEEILTPSQATLELVKWSMQTACGMEFIASKKIIHGDLAARNVLLTKNKDVKIADFGLSRKLYSDPVYVKTGVEPLPWRWMSVESLRDMNFSTSSDVWSFGISLWEYFTFGSIPYRQCQYSQDFVNLLACGQLQLEKPDYARDEIYDMMKQCWNVEPRLRPSFTDLRLFLEGLYTQHSQQGESIFASTNSEL